MKYDLSPLLIIVESLGNLKYNFTPNCLVVYPNNPEGFSITVILGNDDHCLMCYDLMQIDVSISQASEMLSKALKGEIRLKVLKFKNQIVEWNLEKHVDGEWKHLTKMDFMYWYSLNNARVSHLKDSMIDFDESGLGRDAADRFNYSYSHIFIA